MPRKASAAQGDSIDVYEHEPRCNNGLLFYFGIVIAITGCMNGMHSGRSASAVGDAATSAVVAGVVFIIVIDGLFAIITSLLGI